MYSRKDYLESIDCRKQCLARNNEGLDWNYAIAPIIDRDLHEKLLPFNSDDLLPFVQILPLIRSGYFDTALNLVSAISAEGDLQEVQDWLIDALTEAREA